MATTKEKKKILIVDDEEAILTAVQIILEAEGYDVETSADETFLENLRTRGVGQPNLILLDVLLSGADGREICKELKMNEITRKIPIIMFSAYPSAKETTKKAGADAFIAKPFDMNDLLSKVKKFAV